MPVSIQAHFETESCKGTGEIINVRRDELILATDCLPTCEEVIRVEFRASAEWIHIVGSVSQVDADRGLVFVPLLEISDSYVEFLENLTLCRRDSERVSLSALVTRADDLAPGLYAAVNISEGGICLRSTRAERVNGFVALRFRLDGEDVHVYARIVWCRPYSVQADLHTVGLEFLGLSSASHARVRDYVRRNCAER